MKKSLFDIIENELSSNKVSKAIVQKLEEKYNKKFQLRKLGNRYGAGTFEEATAYCVPNDEKKLVFKVTFDMVTNTLKSDDFYIKNTCYMVEKNILEEFKKLKVDVIAKVEIVGKNTLEKAYTVEEFSRSFKNSNFLATVLIKNDIKQEQLNQVYECIRSKYPEIQLRNLIYTIDAKRFEECNKEAELLPALSISFVEKYSPRNIYRIKICDNEITNL